MLVAVQGIAAAWIVSAAARKTCSFAAVGGSPGWLLFEAYLWCHVVQSKNLMTVVCVRQADSWITMHPAEEHGVVGRVQYNFRL